jgi:hypothetical protein
VPGALEGEVLKVASRTGGANGAQAMAEFKLGKWSGDAHVWWTGAKPKDQLVLEFPVAKDGEYEIFVVLTKAVDYGIVTLAIDGAKPTAPIDLFNDGVINTPPISLGTHKLSAGTHKLAVTIVGANPKAAQAFMFGLDYIFLSTKP